MSKEIIDVVAIGGGVAGQRICMNKFFDSAVVGEVAASRMRGHIVEPHLPLQELSGRPHMEAALDRGHLTVSDQIPEDRHFDIAYIGSPTGMHAASLEQVLDMPDRPARIIVEKPVASGESEENHLGRLLRRRDVDAERIYAHEPYLLSTGLQKMLGIAAVQRRNGNFPTDIRVRSTKDRTPDVRRGRTGNDPALGAFGIEFPHTHAAASLLAGSELGPRHLRRGRNLYYKAVNGDNLSEGTYTEFEHNGAVVRVAQGLGPFVMANTGEMTAHSEPEITRDAEVHFASGHHLHLNLRPAVDSKARPYRQSVLSAYDPSGEMYNQELVPDYPAQTLFRRVLQELHDPTLPPLSGIDIMSSLVRCRSIRLVRNEARVISGIKL